MATAFIERFILYCRGSRTLIALVAINILWGALLLIHSVGLRLFGLDDSMLYRWVALPADPISFIYHPWTIFTYMVSHFSLWHLLFNTLWLLWFGRMLCDTMSDKSLLILYAGGGIVGGVLYIATAAFFPTPGAWLTGASASVLAVITATGIIMPHRRVSLFLLGDVKFIWVAIVAIAITLIGSGSASLPTQAAHYGGILWAVAYLFFSKKMPAINLHKMRSHEQRPASVKINTRATLRAMQNRVPDSVRLDQLLDKVRVSGYDSLSATEKTELNHISSRLK